MSCDNGCRKGCDCNKSPGSDGYMSPESRANAGPTYRQSNCWGVMSGESVVAANGAIAITLSFKNYAWLKPRVLRLSAVDPDTGATLAGAVSLSRVEGLGRNVIGSPTLNGASIDVYAQRGLRLGGDIAEMTAANEVTVAGVNNSTKSLRIAVFVEGEAAQ